MSHPTSMFSHPLLANTGERELVLASTSPRRLEVLESVGFSGVVVVKPDFEENLNKAEYSVEEVSVLAPTGGIGD